MFNSQPNGANFQNGYLNYFWGRYPPGPIAAYPNVPSTIAGASNVRPRMNMSQTNESQYALYKKEQRESKRASWYWNLTRKKCVIIGVIGFVVFVILAVVLGLIPFYLDTAKGPVGFYRLKVDNAMKLNNTEIVAILQKTDADRTSEEKQTLRLFTEKLENELNDKLKSNFGPDVDNINAVTLVPSGDGQVLINFDVNTFKVSKAEATSINSNMKSVLSKSSTFESLASSSNVFRNPSVAAFVLNAPEKILEVTESPNSFLIETTTKDTTTTTDITTTAAITTTTTTILTTETTTFETTTVTEELATTEEEVTVPEETTIVSTTVTTQSTTSNKPAISAAPPLRPPNVQNQLPPFNTPNLPNPQNIPNNPNLNPNIPNIPNLNPNIPNANIPPNVPNSNPNLPFNPNVQPNIPSDGLEIIEV